MLPLTLAVNIDGLIKLHNFTTSIGIFLIIIFVLCRTNYNKSFIQRIVYIRVIIYQHLLYIYKQIYLWQPLTILFLFCTFIATRKLCSRCAVSTLNLIYICAYVVVPYTTCAIKGTNWIPLCILYILYTILLTQHISIVATLKLSVHKNMNMLTRAHEIRSISIIYLHIYCLFNIDVCMYTNIFYLNLIIFLYNIII